jgi:3-phosphoshikimate 1-carboxyvinyltransferase
MQLCAHPSGSLTGEARLPGDKSLSHRALMLAAMAAGESRIEGLLEGEDVLATARALQALGTGIERQGGGRWRVDGVGIGGMAEPEDVLDLGNSGTGVRLLTGLLAGHPFTTFLTGDSSLRRRPMGRVTAPLAEMGARFIARSGDRLPLAVQGSGELLPLTWHSPVASAQVKSAVLLAGLHAPGRTTVIEPRPSRDHTERMLRSMGAEVVVHDQSDGSRAVTVVGQPELRPTTFQVPGDPSSAAFVAVAALLHEDSSVRITGIGVNPSRTGLYATLEAMGARLRFVPKGERGGEPVADLEVETSPLQGVEVPAERAPSMIDEYPILAVAAAFARGTTVMRGLAELRVKESDRLGVMAEGLAACGVRVEVGEDTLTVHGSERPQGGATIDARQDHRIAMSFLVLGGAARQAVTVAGAEAIDTSFPGFALLMNRLGARIEPVESRE